MLLCQPCRYQGRLTWKGTANIRNPAVAVALEILLEAYRTPRPPPEPAPPMAGLPDGGPLALPVKLCTDVPGAGEGVRRAAGRLN